MKQLLLLSTLLLISCGKRYNDTNLKNAINDLNNSINVNQELYEELLVRVVELETNQVVLELIDPCPEINASFREVLVKTNDGLFAYFQKGNNRFLTVLSDGEYQTTDSRSCPFEIMGGNVL